MCSQCKKKLSKMELKRNRELYKNNIKRKKEYDKKYRKENLFRHKILEAERRAKVRKVTHNFSEAEWNSKIGELNDKCPICQNYFSENNELTIDHNPPLSRVEDGFVYCINNMLPMCRTCNSSKQTKSFDEFLEWRNLNGS